MLTRPERQNGLSSSIEQHGILSHALMASSVLSLGAPALVPIRTGLLRKSQRTAGARPAQASYSSVRVVRKGDDRFAKSSYINTFNHVGHGRPSARAVAARAASVAAPTSFDAGAEAKKWCGLARTARGLLPPRRANLSWEGQRAQARSQALPVPVPSCATVSLMSRHSAHRCALHSAPLSCRAHFWAAMGSFIALDQLLIALCRSAGEERPAVLIAPQRSPRAPAACACVEGGVGASASA